MYQNPKSNRKAKSILGQKNIQLTERKKFSKTSNYSTPLASIYNLFQYQSCVRFNDNSFWAANFAEFNGIRDRRILNRSEIQLNPDEKIYITTSILMELISLHKSLDRVIDKFAFVPAEDSFRNTNSTEMETAVVNLSGDYPQERNLRLKKSLSDTQIVPSIEKLFDFVKRYSEDVDNLSLEAILSNNSIRLAKSTCDLTSVNRKKLQKAESMIKSCIINLESVYNFLNTEEGVASSREKGDEYIVSGFTTKPPLKARKKIKKDTSKVILNFKRKHPDSDLKIIIRKNSNPKYSTNKHHIDEGYLSYYPATQQPDLVDEIKIPNSRISFDKTPSTSTHSTSTFSDQIPSIPILPDNDLHQLNPRKQVIKYGSAVEVRGDLSEFEKAVKKRPCLLGDCSCTKLHFQESTNLTFRNDRGEDMIVSVKIKRPQSQKEQRQSVEKHSIDYGHYQKSPHEHHRSDPHVHGGYDHRSSESHRDHHSSDDHREEHDSDHHEAFYTTYSSSQILLGKPRKTKDQICSSMDLDVETLTAKVRKQRNRILHNKPEIQKGLNEIGAENLIKASRPAKCCRKRTIIGEHANYSPYSPSLNSLPLDTEDLEIIKQNATKHQKEKYNTAAYYISLGEEEKAPMWILFQPHVNYLTQCSESYALKQSTSSLDNSGTEEKLKYYINLTNDSRKNKIPHPRRVYEVRFFEIQKIKNVQSSTSNVSGNSTNTFLRNSIRPSTSNDSDRKAEPASSSYRSSRSTVRRRSTSKCKSVRVYNISQRSLPNDERGLNFYVKAYQKYMKIINDRGRDISQSAPSSSKDKESVTRIFYNKLAERIESDRLPTGTKSENTSTSNQTKCPKHNNYFKSIGSDPTELFEKILRTYNYQKEARPRTRRKKPEFYMARSKSDMNTKFRHKFEDADHVMRNHLREYAKKKHLKSTPSKTFMSYMTQMLCDLGNSKKSRSENEGDYVNNSIPPPKKVEVKTEKPKEKIISDKWDINKLTKSLHGVNSQPNVEAGMDEEETPKAANELKFHIHVQKCNKEKRIFLDKMETNNVVQDKPSISKNSQTDKLKNQMESCQTDRVDPTKLSLMDIRNDYSQNTILSSSVNSDNDIDYGYYTESCDPYEAFNCNQTAYDVFDNCVLLFDDILSHASNYENDKHDISDSISTTLLKLKQMMATKYLEDDGNPFNRNFMVYQNACCQQSQPTIFKRLFAPKKRRHDVAPGPCNVGYTNNTKMHGCSDACNFDHLCTRCGYYIETRDCYPPPYVKFCSCFTRQDVDLLNKVQEESVGIRFPSNFFQNSLFAQSKSKIGSVYSFFNCFGKKVEAVSSRENCAMEDFFLTVCPKRPDECFQRECMVCPPYKPCSCENEPQKCIQTFIDLCTCTSRTRDVSIAAKPLRLHRAINTYPVATREVGLEKCFMHVTLSLQTLTTCNCGNCMEEDDCGCGTTLPCGTKDTYQQPCRCSSTLDSRMDIYKLRGKRRANALTKHYPHPEKYRRVSARLFNEALNEDVDESTVDIFSVTNLKSGEFLRSNHRETFIFYMNEKLKNPFEFDSKEKKKDKESQCESEEEEMYALTKVTEWADGTRKYELIDVSEFPIEILSKG